MEYISKSLITDRIEAMSRRWGEAYDAQQILGDIEDMTPANPYEALEHRLGILIEDIESGRGDYKYLPGFYETLAIIRGIKNGDGTGKVFFMRNQVQDT